MSEGQKKVITNIKSIEFKRNSHLSKLHPDVDNIYSEITIFTEDGTYTLGACESGCGAIYLDKD